MGKMVIEMVIAMGKCCTGTKHVVIKKSYCQDLQQGFT